MNPHRARRLLPYALFALGVSTARLVVAGAAWASRLGAGGPGADNRVSLWSAPQWWDVVLWAACLLPVVYLVGRSTTDDDRTE